MLYLLCLLVVDRNFLYQGDICKHRCCALGSFCGGRLILSHHSASFVMSTLIVSFLYFNLLFFLEDNLISLEVR